MKSWTVVALLLVTTVSIAQSQEPQPPCWHAEFDAFTPLIGEWTVRAENRLPDGKWEASDARCWITREFKGCMLREHYSGKRLGMPFEARGLYGFNNANGKLQRVWVDSEHGMLAVHEGSKVGDTVVLDYEMMLRGYKVILRDVFSGMTSDAFRLERSRSNDQGKTWDVTSKLVFTRVATREVAPLPSVELPAELARVLTDYEAAWQAEDEVALANLFAEDGFVLPGGGVLVRGREAIREHYKSSGGPLSLRALAWSTQGDTGYIIGAFARNKGEKDVGKFTLTLRKDNDGRWLIMSDMDN